MTNSTETTETTTDFFALFDVLANEILSELKQYKLPEEAYKWFKKVGIYLYQNIYYNVPGGKMNRGQSVLDTLKILKEGEITQEEDFKAKVLGWCVEWVSLI